MKKKERFASHKAKAGQRVFGEIRDVWMTEEATKLNFDIFGVLRICRPLSAVTQRRLAVGYEAMKPAV
jgi:hypothetical protein